jgi:hypothetical protein
MTSDAVACRPGRAPKPMSTWRLEWLRMTRTPRAIALGGVYLFFGLLGPVTARYLQQIINRAQTGVHVIVTHPTPKDGIANYISQISQTGLIVVIVITAGALTFDAHRGLSTFLRTRATTMWQLIAPRVTVNAAAAVTAYTLGTLTTWRARRHGPTRRPLHSTTAKPATPSCSADCARTRPASLTAGLGHRNTGRRSPATLPAVPTPTSWRMLTMMPSARRGAGKV